MAPKEYNDKLEQLILDENETVTYKLLSKELKIHVNEAKKCLYDFLKLHKSKDVALFAYYFLSGTVDVDGLEAQKVVIVSENNFEKVKSDFKKVKSCHVYSLSKGECQDESAIYKSQSWCKKWAEEHKEYSAIKHPNVNIKEPCVQKLVVKKFVTNIAVSTKSSTVKQLKNEGTPSLFSTNSTKNSTNNKVEFEKKSTTDESQSSNMLNKNVSVNAAKANNKPSSSKTTLGSLWQKLEDKSKKGNKDDSPTEVVKSNNSKAAAKMTGQNNILSMFSRQAEKGTSNPVKLTTSNFVPPPATNTLSAENIHDNDVKETCNKETVDNGLHKNGKRKSSQRKNKQSAKQSNNIESDEEIKPKAKKHRRICTMDDSDSESESEEAKDMAQRSLLSSEEPTDVSMHISDDNEDPIPPTPPVLLSKGKKKVWKTIKKTFEEDGFLVSKQEKVLVSASDSDEELTDSKESISDIKSKQDTFLYRNKQTSLTSFFK